MPVEKNLTRRNIQKCHLRPQVYQRGLHGIHKGKNSTELKESLRKHKALQRGRKNISIKTQAEDNLRKTNKK